MLANTYDFLTLSRKKELLDDLLVPMRRKWGIMKQKFVKQHLGLAVSNDSKGIRISAPEACG